MNFKIFDDVRADVYRKPGFILTAKVCLDDNFDRLLLKVGEEHSDMICSVLNKINNQGLERVVCNRGYYVKEGETLPLRLLSTGESVFLASIIGNMVGEHIYMYRGIRQLTKRSLLTFLKVNSDNEYLTVLCPSEHILDYYVEMMEG